MFLEFNIGLLQRDALREVLYGDKKQTMSP